MNLTTRKQLSYLLTPVLVAAIVFAITTWPQEAQAHKGHAGSIITFMQKKAALKEMLPTDAKIVKRKQPLKENALQWAQKTYAVELDDKLYSYYLATHKTNKAITGAAYVGEMHYRQGELKLAVGIDADNRITQVAILGVSKKYVVDFEDNVGTGLIADYAGLSLQKLISKANELASSDKATREFAVAVRDAAVLMAAFIYSAK